MREYIEPIWGWHEDWQAEYFLKKYDPATRSILQVDGEDAGVIMLEVSKEGYYLSLIEILPKFQNCGLGSAVLHHLIEITQKENLPLSLHVLKTNHRAYRWYERLGFKVVDEEAHRYKMIHYPSRDDNAKF